jgi:hypothetical protein
MHLRRPWNLLYIPCSKNNSGNMGSNVTNVRKATKQKIHVTAVPGIQVQK